MPFPFMALFAAVKVVCVVCGAAFCTHKVTEAYKKGQKVKGLKYKDREEARRLSQENNQKLDERDKELDKKIEQGNQKEKQLEKEASEIKEKLDDPNISKEKKTELESQLIFIQTQLDDIKKNNKSHQEEKKKNAEQRKKNNQAINSVGSIHDGDKGWIWEFLTLENILIMLAIYALYNIVRDEGKR